MTRILVADDDRTTRILLSETLRAENYTVVAVADGSAALKKLKEGKFDIALLDVWMPRVNGLEVLEKLGDKNGRTKVIIMTSDDAPEIFWAQFARRLTSILRNPSSRRRWWRSYANR